MAAVILVRPKRFVDERGWFSETYHFERSVGLGIPDVFVQDNHSLSRPAGTLRGLHFQAPPRAQAKLVRCVRGAICDVAVDLRRKSPTFGRHVSAILTVENGWQLYIPAGFGHGFVTLEPDTEVVYKVTDYYAPEQDGGIRWDDPDIGIAWPLAAGQAPVLSAKDEKLPLLRDFAVDFAYDGQPLAALDV